MFLMLTHLPPEFLLLGEVCGSSSGEVCEYDTVTVSRSSICPSMGNAFKLYDIIFSYFLYFEKIKVGL
jgi:hypothetical protein